MKDLHNISPNIVEKDPDGCMLFSRNWLPFIDLHIDRHMYILPQFVLIKTLYFTFANTTRTYITVNDLRIYISPIEGSAGAIYGQSNNCMYEESFKKLTLLYQEWIDPIPTNN